MSELTEIEALAQEWWGLQNWFAEYRYGPEVEARLERMHELVEQMHDAIPTGTRDVLALLSVSFACGDDATIHDTPKDRTVVAMAVRAMQAVPGVWNSDPFTA